MIYSFKCVCSILCGRKFLKALIHRCCGGVSDFRASGDLAHFRGHNTGLLYSVSVVIRVLTFLFLLNWPSIGKAHVLSLVLFGTKVADAITKHLFCIFFFENEKKPWVLTVCEKESQKFVRVCRQAILVG
jgi:hypothetical protein